MAKTEDIEAKLAAYVDGEIDEAGRVEIEKHLASNPQHRELLADLSKQRDLLRALPRDMAPGDVAETINSQLERAVLLGDVDADSEIAGRIGRFSQLRAIAAMLLLTGGLAGVIYYLLPSANRRSPELADLRIEAQSTTAMSPVVLATVEEEPAPQTSIAVVTDQPKTLEAETRPQIALGDNSPIGSRGGGGFGGGGGFDRSISVSNAMPPRQEIFSDVLQSRAPQAKVNPAPVVETASEYVVSSGDPQATARELRDYLQSNNISWETQPSEAMPMPLDAGQQQDALASRSQQPTVQLKSGPPQQMQSEQRFVARQVTQQQASALRGWLGDKQARPRTSIDPKDSHSQTIAPATSPDASLSQKQPDIAAGALNGLSMNVPSSLNPTPPTPTTLPFALGGGLTELLDFAPARLDAPGIEFKSRPTDALPDNNPALQAPATQPEPAAPILSTLTPVIPLPIDPERVDVVIVLESQAPATQPAAVEPAMPAAEAP